MQFKGERLTTTVVPEKYDIAAHLSPLPVIELERRLAG